MLRSLSSPPRRLSDPRGTILIISLLLLVVAGFLAGLVLLLARTESTVAATSKGSIQAADAAEYGIELAINNLDPSKTLTAISTQTLGPGVTAAPGLRDGSNATPANLGNSPCPAGYSTALGCTAYTVNATGSARGWYTVTASTQLEKSESIYRGCSGTEYSC